MGTKIQWCMAINNWIRKPCMFVYTVCQGASEVGNVLAMCELTILSKSNHKYSKILSVRCEMETSNLLGSVSHTR